MTIGILSIINSIINISLFFRNSAFSQVVLPNVHAEVLAARIVTFVGGPVMRMSELEFSLL